MINSPKIEPRHLRLRALVYVRQSTPQQLQHNQESTRRQYQLAERAQQMGWPAAQVHVIDDDLGLSGASSDQRGGFQRLVASIGLGEVGIILVTEVSRLSRCNSDWHRVIELCAVFAALIADEDGVYDPRDPNDRLLLGVKGTLFAAELHILQARMRGGLINKAGAATSRCACPSATGASATARWCSTPTRRCAQRWRACSSASPCCATAARCSATSPSTASRCRA